MANTQKYLNHLLQNTGITPACSEEERAAADIVADIFRDHGFQPEIQEFSASSSEKIAQAVMGILVFAGSVLMGIGGAVGIVGVILAAVGAIIFIMERSGHPVLSNMGAGGLSQNVIAYHKASGPLASPRNRPVVVVAHYDSPRADLLAREPYASYRPILVKLLPFAMVAPALIAVIRLLPIPGPAKIVMWVIAIIVALVPLANAVAIIANKYVLPYTSGSVCNKSSVAAMLGVMDAVAPYQGVNEFPGDIPFDQYMEQQRSYAPVMEPVDEEAFDADFEAEQDAEEDAAGFEDEAEQPVEQFDDAEDDAYEESDAAATAMWTAVEAEEAVAAGLAAARQRSQQVEGDPSSTVAMTSEQIAAAMQEVQAVAAEPAEEALDNPAADQTAVFQAPVEMDSAAPAEMGEGAEGQVAPAAPKAPVLPRNEAGNIRYGTMVLRALGMVADSCNIEYEPGAEAVAPKPATQPDPQPAAAPQPAVQVVPEAPEVDEQAVLDSQYDQQYEMGQQDEPSVEQDSFVPASAFEYHEPAGEAQDEWDSEEVSSDYDESAEVLEEQDYSEDESMWAPNEEFSESEAYVEDEYQQNQGEEPPAPSENVYLAYGDADDYILEAEYEIIDDGSFAEEDLDEGSAVADSGDGEDAADEAEVFDTDDRDDAVCDADVEASDEIEAAADPEDSSDEADDEGSVDEVDAGDTVNDELLEDASDSVDADSDDEVDDVEVQPAVTTENEEDVPMVDVTADTQLFQMPVSEVAQGATQAMPVPVPAGQTSPQRPVETVDSLMAQIAQPQPTVHVPPRNLNIPDITVPPNARRIPAVPGIEAFQQQNAAQNRSPLFDLPDPSVKPADPFASPAPSPATTSAASRGFSVVSSAPAPAAPEGAFETISAPAPQAKKERRGLGGLFGRKKKNQDSMSDWLGVDEDYDAKRTGGEIGSWDNFNDDGDGWKGGATGVDGVTDLELRDAITSMGDDELLGHDIWFVATGASECGNAGLKAFLETHRDKLRGVFLINLESVGAGQVAMLASEGDTRVLKGDKRIMKLVQRVSGDFHHEIGAVDMPYVKTDAHAAMSMSLRSLTIAGIDGAHFACSHSEEDMPYNVNEANVNKVADVVTEVIRRS